MVQQMKQYRVSAVIHNDDLTPEQFEAAVDRALYHRFGARVTALDVWERAGWQKP